MADVFISYATVDRPRARALADALQSLGWSVWWDRNLVGGAKIPKVIAAELANARCVIVLWSAASVESTWVRDEANRGLKRGVLVTAKVDELEPPLGFGDFHAADLVGWNGDTAAPAFKQFVSGLAQLLGEPPKGSTARESGPLPPPVTGPRPAPDRDGPRVASTTMRWAAVSAVGLIVVGLGIWGIYSYQADVARKEANFAIERRTLEDQAAKARAELAAREKALEEQQRTAAAEAEKRAKDEQQRTAAAEAEKRAKDEQQRAAAAEAEKRAKDEQQRTAAAEAEKRAKDEQQRAAAAEAEKRAKDQQQRAAAAEAEKRAKDEQQRAAEPPRKAAASPQIQFSANVLDFGTREIGTEQRGGARRVTLTTTDGSTLTFSYKLASVNFSSAKGGVTSSFRIVDGNCPRSPTGGITLPQRCWLAVEFTPTRAGPQDDVLEIWVSGTTEIYRIRLSGTGLAKG